MALLKDVKVRWLKALRSGRYKQTRSVLENYHGNCCLGVLCRVMRARRVGGDSKEGHVFQWGEDADFISLPDSLREHVGLTHRQRAVLERMNDKGKTFDQIADYIERRIKGV